MGIIYDSIGTGYTLVRREDPRIAEQLAAVLGDCDPVVNVGAGTGSYEPSDRQVVAVEPSAVMIAQRPPHAAPAVRAAAAALNTSWWLHDYFPAMRELVLRRSYPSECIAEVLGPVELIPVPVPADCADGFEAAYWQRPEATTSSIRTAIYQNAQCVALPVPQRVENDLRHQGWLLQIGRVRHAGQHAMPPVRQPVSQFTALVNEVAGVQVAAGDGHRYLQLS
jgi:hypothetical protein